MYKFYLDAMEYRLRFIDACSDGNLKVIESLIESDHLGVTDYENGLTIAIANNKLNIAILLIKHAENLNPGLEMACARGNKELALLLLNHKANPNIGLYAACRAGNAEMAQLMIEHDAYRLNQSMDYLYTEHKSHRRNKHKKYADVALVLVENGTSNLGRALKIACTYKHEKLARLLISKRVVDNAKLFEQDIMWLIKLGMSIDKFIKYTDTAKLCIKKMFEVEDVLKKELKIITDVFSKIHEY